VALTNDRNTMRRDGRDFHQPVAAGALIFSGAIVVLNAAGFAEPASAAEGLKFPALATERADNREGQDGDVLVRTERIVVSLDADSSITRAAIGATVYLLDDHTVTAESDGLSPAGLLVDILDGQAWVDLAQA